MDQIGVIVLAAGGSRRLGRPKQLLDYQGKPMLQHILDQVAPLSWTARVLVLGAFADDIEAALQTEPFQVVVNKNWAEGLAGSIRAGLQRALEICPDLAGLLFLLSDQPHVSTALIADLVELYRSSGKPVAACRYADTIGVPAMFSRSFFPALSGLQGDAGAGRIIRQNPDQTVVLPFPQGAVDVDTKADYEDLLQRKT